MSTFAGTGRSNQDRRAERGAALIVVMVMLLLLTVLGMSLLTSSTTELQIAGNYRTTQEAFYGANGALEAAQIDPATYSTIIPDVQNKYSSAVIKVGNSTATYRVEYVGTDQAPPGFSEDFQTSLYVIDVTGSAPNNAVVELESEIGRVAPKPKDLY